MSEKNALMCKHLIKTRPNTAARPPAPVLGLACWVCASADFGLGVWTRRCAPGRCDADGRTHTYIHTIQWYATTVSMLHPHKLIVTFTLIGGVQ